MKRVGGAEIGLGTKLLERLTTTGGTLHAQRRKRSRLTSGTLDFGTSAGKMYPHSIGF